MNEAEQEAMAYLRDDNQYLEWCYYNGDSL